MRRLPAIAILLGGCLSAAFAKDKQMVEAPTPVIGVRGLEKSSVATDTSARDYEAIKRLEAVKVSPKELVEFLKEGKLK